MQITYIEKPSGKWTFGMKKNGEIVWESPELFPDAYTAALNAIKVLPKH